MGCCFGTDGLEDERSSLVEGQRSGQRQPRRRPARVSLELVNVIDEPLPTIYYVIVGRGPMAVVNHRTLRGSTWGVARLAGRTVLHVGFPNPWPRYLLHGLGQPNHLLSFPGFVNQPSVGGAIRDGGLDSQHFGTCIDTELGLLAHQRATEWVALIQARGGAQGVLDARIADATEIGGDAVRDVIAPRIADAWPPFPQGQAPYRLCLYNPDNGTVRWVYAAAIDICTGPGRPKVDRPRDGDSATILAARTPPWLRPEVWGLVAEWRDRRTLNGVDAIRDEVQWDANERICVTAGGGVGLNAAEKARNQDCVLDWFGRSGLMAIFNNPRNITFLRPPDPSVAVACDPGERVPLGITAEGHLIASSLRHRMGLGAILASAANNQAGTRVSVELAAVGQTDSIRDWRRAPSRMHADGYWTFSDPYRVDVEAMGVVPSRLYHRLVIPNGQDTEQVGQPNAFAHHLGFLPVVQAGRLVSLATADGLVRVLGAACNNYPGFTQGEWNRGEINGTAAADMWTFHATLPKSAVPDGFIICGVNTALANRYFVDHPNRNVNTMTRAEIFAVVGDGPLADLIVQQRNPNNGYRDLAHLQQVCVSIAAELDQFLFAYG